jgi:pimeloyl-ACP methyl ester carboxylesterase
MKTRFDSIAKAPTIDVPMLALIAEKDEVIPPVHAFNLVEHWEGASKAVVFNGVGHNTIQDHEDFWKSIGEFLDKLNE